MGQGDRCAAQVGASTQHRLKRELRNKNTSKAHVDLENCNQEGGSVIAVAAIGKAPPKST